MEQLKHFSHHHLLYLVHLQQTHINENSDEEEEDDDDNLQVVVQEAQHGGQCKMCEEGIYSFHLCYYKCHQCDYSLHKFCAELPTTLKSHPLHDYPGHELTLSKNDQFTESDPSFNLTERFDSDWRCGICLVKYKMFYNYHCSICKFDMDIVCATMSQQKMDHPSHPHQLERKFKSTLANCQACGNEHKGTFYHCIICSSFRIHLDCALLPTKLLIQQSTKDNFTHSHFLTLTYSFPYTERKAKFFPRCKVCDAYFDTYVWLYRCDKCQYYVHVECASSKTEPFMSIFLPAGLGKTIKNFKDNDHPNLLHCPFPDESCNLLKHYFYNRKEFFVKEKDNKSWVINHFSHPHPLILFETQTSLCNKSIAIHEPMKKIQVLCDGCVKPITSVPFYKCSQYNFQKCGFVLHQWCAKLSFQVHDHPGHPEHTLVLLPNIPSKLFGVFKCEVCGLPSNGFAYGCTMCEYYVDINCSLIPEEITHEGHPNHLLFRIKGTDMLSEKFCKACYFSMTFGWGFHCPSCDFYIHTRCALLLHGEVRHKYDKHPLSLRYGPVENHPQDYFCEICEDGMISIGRQWFYHCTTCAWSMHAACVPLILQSELAIYSKYRIAVFAFLNVKFGGMGKIKGHPHSVAFVQGIESRGQCNICDDQLQYSMILKCLECDFAIHYECGGMLTDDGNEDDEGSESLLINRNEDDEEESDDDDDDGSNSLPIDGT